ncbi:MAG: hypothetical protein KF771_00815 [Burkholderiales bacterium]|nr:hypothetical protein [Burkholderiales bacterium]
MRHTLIALSLLLGTAIPGAAWIPAAAASSAISISIGIHHAGYPELVLVPGYPVYYAPQLPANYFFYDGYYWLYHEDHWYMSDWYDGPWTAVDPDEVPLFVLRVPVRYYVSPPLYFHGWYVDAAPRWHIHWGPRWTRYRPGWDHWDRRIVYAPAPLPLYQRHYVGDRYPRGEYRHVIHREHYRYRPHDTVVRERHQRQQAAPRPQAQRPDFQRMPQQRYERGQDWNRTPSMPPQPSAVPRQPSAVPQQPSAVPQQPAAVPVQPRPQQQPLFQPQAPRERGERGELRGPDPQRAATRPSGPAPQAVQSRPQREPRAQQAPRPQFQQRAPQMRGEAQSPRGNFERRQGGERGPGRS